VSTFVGVQIDALLLWLVASETLPGQAGFQCLATRLFKRATRPTGEDWLVAFETEHETATAAYLQPACCSPQAEPDAAGFVGIPRSE